MKIKTITRWILFIGLICWGLLCLNISAFYWWGSWGPPCEYPLAFMQKSKIYLGFGISLIATAVMIFIAFRKDFSWRKSKYKYIWFVILIICIAYPKVKERILIDECFASGGVWNAKYFQCDH